MVKNIRTIITPFLMVSYVFGLRIAISNHLKLWFSVIYMLLIWSVYYFLSSSALMISFHAFFSFEDHICHYLEVFTTLLSIVFGIYHDKVKKCYNTSNIINKKQLL